MQVLKKFGVFILFCLFAGLNTYAKTTKNHSSSTKPKSAKSSKVVASKDKKAHSTSKASNHHSKSKVAAARPKTSDKTVTIHFVKGPEAITVSSESSAQLVQTNIDKKPVASAVSPAINNDLLYNRTVTKIILPKKEESSFSSSVMDWVKDKYSCMIDVLPNQISNVMLYRFIDDWYGVKYRMGGTSKKGVDCSAFVQTLYKYVFGMDLLRTACLQFNSSELIMNPADLKEGDLVFFKVNTSRISHVGVYLRNNFFVHSASSKGVSIANLNSAYWSKYFAGGGRILQKS